MDFSVLQQYSVPVVIVLFFGWRFVRFRLVKNKIPELLKNGAVIVDVRGAAEYASGSSRGSMNIPFNELEQGAQVLDPAKTIVLCCASGTRSGMAAALLRRKGFKKLINAGPWSNTDT